MLHKGRVVRWKELLESLTRYPRTSLVIAALVTIGAAIAYLPFGILESIGGIAAALLQLAAMKVMLMLVIDLRGITRSQILARILFFFACLLVAMVLAFPIFLQASTKM